VDKKEVIKKYEHIKNKFEEFSLENEFSFVKRLGRENFWSEDYSKKVIDEYLKFCTLSLFVNHGITPSDEVDQVWHLHLQYTDHYINIFCKELLQKNFYHGPTKGGTSEKQKYNCQYEETLKSYKKYFGKPNPKYWPSNKVRFGDSIYHQRVNIKNNFVISKEVFILFCFIMFSSLFLNIINLL